MRLLFILLQAILITACTSSEISPEPAGENVQAGTVDFAYVNRPGTIPSIDWAQVQGQAVERCASMGYTNARETDEVDRLCITRGVGGFQAGVSVGAARQGRQGQQIGVPIIGGDCNEIRYTVTYQCTD
jgi:hypothetical protein